jgi:hypothetical protein
MSHLRSLIHHPSFLPLDAVVIEYFLMSDTYCKTLEEVH